MNHKDYDTWKLSTPWQNEEDAKEDTELIYKREDLNNALTCLYDYEYIDMDKFYNCKYNYELLEAFENDDDSVLDDLKEALQSFLDFESNYNLSIDDFLIN